MLIPTQLRTDMKIKLRLGKKNFDSVVLVLSATYSPDKILKKSSRDICCHRLHLNFRN